MRPSHVCFYFACSEDCKKRLWQIFDSLPFVASSIGRGEVEKMNLRRSRRRNMSNISLIRRK